MEDAPARRLRLSGAEDLGPEVPSALAESFRAMQDKRRSIAARLAAAETFGSELRAFQDVLAARARAEGASFAQIGRALGITRQAAQQRYGSTS